MTQRTWRQLALAGVLATGMACGPPDGTRRPLEKTYDDGSTVRVRGEEMLLGGEWVMDGPIQFFREDGSKKAEGTYRDGLENGAFTQFLDDGTRAEGAFVDGKRHGQWTYWHLAGTKQEEGEYDQGDRVGRWKLWFEEGALREENDYVAGQMHGERRSYKADGSLDRGRSGVFVEGKQVGPLPRE